MISPAGTSLVGPLGEGRHSQELLDDPVKLPDDYLKMPCIAMQEGPWKFTALWLSVRNPLVLTAWQSRPGGP